ncbi:hypothetical protein GGR56DRAFT_316431 [Xylariaceae sp. FL0804]|nr:hypothetical protein GGR56DRAFT_316431 [Xylariaceae sp. FL0804]
MMHGLKGSSTSLKSLAACTLGIGMIDDFWLDKIRVGCTQLESISLAFDTHHSWLLFPATDPRTFADRPSPLLIQEARSRTERSTIARFLGAYPDLEDIHISFTAATVFAEPLIPARLSDILAQGFKWQRLRRISLGAVQTQRPMLQDFLYIHRGTIRIVHLRDCHLATTSWTRLFRWMKSVLQLDDITITGRITGQVEDGESHSWIGDEVQAGREEAWLMDDSDVHHGQVRGGCLTGELRFRYFFGDLDYPPPSRTPAGDATDV